MEQVKLWFDNAIDIKSCDVIVEKAEAGNLKAYKIKGPFLQGDITNGNKRLYPFEKVLRPAASEFIEKKIKMDRAIGELEHPESPEINLERAAIKITALEEDGTNFIGTAQVLSEKLACANAVRGLIDSGVRFGVSSRGVGTLDESNENDNPTGIRVVTKYKLIAEDIIYDPSGPDCYVDGIVENKQYVLDESSGSVFECNEKAYKEYEKKLSKLPNMRDRKELDQYILSASMKFLGSIRNDVDQAIFHEEAEEIIFEATPKKGEIYRFEKKIPAGSAVSAQFDFADKGMTFIVDNIRGVGADISWTAPSRIVQFGEDVMAAAQIEDWVKAKIVRKIK